MRAGARLRALGVFALVTLVAGCSASGTHAVTAASTAAGDQAQALAIGREYAQCARAHGRPDFPDPAIQDGTLAFPGATKQDNVAVQDACASILQRLPVSMQHHNPPPSAQDLAKLRQFAQCMRDNGVAQWPDPKSDGTFPLIGTPLLAEGKSQRVLDAMQACAHFWDGGIDVS